MLLLEEKLAVDPRAAERLSLEFAVVEAHRPDVPGASSHNGFRGYECWIADLEEDRVQGARGLGSTNGLIAAARLAAGQYLREIAGHYSGKVAEGLEMAAECYDREVESLNKVAEIFPSRGRAQAELSDPQVKKEVTALVREAYAWEKKGVALLEEALTEIQ